MQQFLEPLRPLLAHPFLPQLAEVLIGIIVITIIFRAISASLSHYIRGADTRYRSRKLVTLVSYLLMLLFAASVFSDSLGQLTVIFGVVGAGIAFALQEVIASLAGWSAISLGQFYRPGDRVQVGGITGDVIDISILRTTLMECGAWVKADLYSGRIVRVANSFVFKEPVYNYSRDFPFLWDEITIPVKYGCDHRLARRILQQVAKEQVGEYSAKAQKHWNQMVKKFLIEDAQVEPTVTLLANDNWMEFTIRYVVNFKKRRITKDLLFTQILDEIDKTDGQVALASATFHLVETPTFNVSLTNQGNSQYLGQ
ncbi:Small-conductance mechanosensitive channel [Acaryochloris thomasi RCC1774]|uniref:Small-conductance mechanosensitive channel n=1 Tax=Acaryochloris thomasi RCC1774 TaxID=1764569 RepID=A0A2W1JPH5_9CYAN|nr:mechanosensitive ion channel domain-containing protein [Acaryochloris thomasi]PZD72064.1 Small-conductance mechanosensitive channel [Acaryochloris thomasi RCC1774]